MFPKNWKLVKDTFELDELLRRYKLKNNWVIHKMSGFDFNIITQSLLPDREDISKRAIEILSKWSEFQDIKMQIQFAAVIVGKIDRLKRNASIQSDDIKRKICTLLRNVIRLNVAEDLFSQDQIELLKKGFMLLDADDLKREDLLELNRELRKENLMTMPAWE